MVSAIMSPTTSRNMPSRRTIARLAGSCLCRAVTWDLFDVVLAQVCVCHCGACRRFSGSTHLPFAAVERTRLWPVLEPYIRSGTLQSYTSSSAATRYFCGTCASPVVFDYHEEPHTLWIPMGSLLEDPDLGIGLDPSHLDPTRDSHIFANDQAGYEAALLSSSTLSSLPRCMDFGLYKQDPCQPKEWESIPTMENPVQFVDEKGNLLETTTDSTDPTKTTTPEK